MKRNIHSAGVLSIVLSVVFILSACDQTVESEIGSLKPTVIAMELTSGYDDADPFVDERLFGVQEDLYSLDIDVVIDMEGESGAIEIANNESKDILYRHDWQGAVESETITITLSSIEKSEEYVIRFIGTGIEYAKLTATFLDYGVVELERPGTHKGPITQG